MSAAESVAPSPSAVQPVGEFAALAEYATTAEVLAAAAALRALAPRHLLDLVPAERTLLLVGAAPRDVEVLVRQLRQLPAAASEETAPEQREIPVVYDGEDLEDVAALLGMSRQALVDAHLSTVWTVAFGGFAPGFAYLLPESAGTGQSAGSDDSDSPDGTTSDALPAAGPPWEVPRRDEPRTAVPPGSVGLASRYTGVYPRSSPGGWQLIGRTDADLFDPDRSPPALLTPGIRVRFTAQRPSGRISAPASAIAKAGRSAAAVPARLTQRSTRRGPVGRGSAEILSPGPLSLVQDAGRAGRAAIGISTSGAFDRSALVQANLAVGNPAHAAVIETLVGPLQLRATAPMVIAVAGAVPPVAVRRASADDADVDLSAADTVARPIALDPGDVLEVGPASFGLRITMAVRGGIAAEPVLGSCSRDTLSDLGPGPLEVGSVLRVGSAEGLAAVPAPLPAAVAPAPADAVGADDSTGEEADGPGTPAAEPDSGGPGSAESDSAGPGSAASDRTGSDGAGPQDAASAPPVELVLGPRHQLLGPEAVDALLSTAWTVRPDSDRVGVRLDGPALPLPGGSGGLPSEAMVPGAIQVPPSGLPVVFGPDHPTTGGYPVIGVVTRAGLDQLAQVAPGQVVRFARRD